MVIKKIYKKRNPRNEKYQYVKTDYGQTVPVFTNEILKVGGILSYDVRLDEYLYRSPAWIKQKEWRMTSKIEERWRVLSDKLFIKKNIFNWKLQSIRRLLTNHFARLIG